jgi:hypothetical protein
LLLHVIDTSALDTLNALGLAPRSEEKTQRKRLHHQARLLVRELLQMKEAKGLVINRLLSEGKPTVTQSSRKVNPKRTTRKGKIVS